MSLIGLKVLDSKGAGYTSDVIKAIEFAIANRYALGIDIINLSLGHVPYESAKTDPLVQAVDKASAAGIIVVVAAGNVGISPVTGRPAYGGILSPGNARSAITVGAAHTMGTRTPHRRRDRALQLARADVGRRLRQAGPGRTRPQAAGAG